MQLESDKRQKKEKQKGVASLRESLDVFCSCGTFLNVMSHLKCTEGSCGVGMWRRNKDGSVDETSATEVRGKRLSVSDRAYLRGCGRYAYEF